MKRKLIAALLPLLLPAAGSWGATSAHYAMPAAAITSGGAAMASGSYRQFAMPGPEEAPGISANASRNQLAGLLGFLWGRPATTPEAPVLTGLYAGNRQLRLRFTAPAYNGGADIAAYTARCTPDGGSPVTATGTASPIVITGLVNGVSYGCSVTASNGVGESQASVLLSRVVRPTSVAPLLSIILD